MAFSTLPTKQLSKEDRKIRRILMAAQLTLLVALGISVTGLLVVIFR